MRAVRDAVQRLFEGAKAKNVGAYADYVAGVHNGRPGITPATILYSEDPLDAALEGQLGHGTVLVPWGKKLVAIDGETQLAARYEAANREPETQSDFVAVHICHGLPKAWARQAFHDLNVLAIRPNSAVSIGMDARDPLTAMPRSKPSPITRASDWSAAPSFDLDPKSTGIVVAVLDPDPTLPGSRGHPFLRAIYEAMLDAKMGVGFNSSGDPVDGALHKASVLVELEAHPNTASATITDDTGTVVFDGLSARGLPILSYETTIHCECDYDFEKVVMSYGRTWVMAV